MRGRWLLGVVAVWLITGASACGSSGYQYVENEDHGVFARIPDDWAMHDEEELFDELVSDDVDRDAPDGIWYRGFDAGDDPVVGRIQEGGLATSRPQGYVQIQDLTRVQRERVNVSALRSLIVGEDPLASMQSGQDSRYEVIVDEPAEFDGGIHGVHTVFVVHANSEVAVVDQTVVLDETSSIAYLFVVTCSDRCYSDTYKDEIANVVDSWTIQEGDR